MKRKVVQPLLIGHGNDQEQQAQEVVNAFSGLSRLPSIDYYIRDEDSYLILLIANPSNRFFSILEDALEKINEDNPFKYNTTLKKRATDSQCNYLSLPESKYFQTVLSESLTATRYSFEDDFFSRYIASVSGVEQQIIAQGNHIVYGRRGAGKSSLLAYYMHTLRLKKLPYAWVAMQAFSGRDDFNVVVGVLVEVLIQLKNFDKDSSLIGLIDELESLSESQEDSEKKFAKLIPKLRRSLLSIAEQYSSGITIFLDDVHLIDRGIQPTLLDRIYALSRDNRIFLKISGIKQFVKTWDSSKRLGMQDPGDVQVIQLDNNLTMPDKCKQHIQKILDAHAKYCGLTSVGYICQNGVLNRLVWVSAGVPRDALTIFSRAIAYCISKNHKKVTIAGINMAASEMMARKESDLREDLSSDPGSTTNQKEILDLLTRIKDFCIKEKHINSFLIEIVVDHAVYRRIQELIALRFLHVLTDGITPETIGKRYLGLMLDYGCYVGIRAAKGVDLFYGKKLDPIRAHDLRRLPTFSLLNSNSKKISSSKKGKSKNRSKIEIESSS